MKKYLIFLLLFWAKSVWGQTGEKNYILTRNYKQTGSAVNDVSKVNIQVQYLDGLGRPWQTVAVGQSTTGKDIIVPIEYDALGRQAKNFLPFQSSVATGIFTDNATSLQSSFYQSTTPGLETTDSRGFSETVFDPSPFERPNSVRAAGTLSATATITYGTNTASEVKKYGYTPNSTITSTIVQNGYYAAGTLYKTVTTDENQKLMTEYKDMSGRVILRNAGSDIPTYYVYDDYGQLRGVLQPQYQDANSVSYAFFYSYDQRGRVITKKVPSADPVNMVYDNYDRLVMTQDAVQMGAGKWSFIKYDALGRVAYTGEFSSTANRAAHQALFDASTAHHESTSGSGIGYTLSTTLPSVAETDVRTVNYYDNYSFPSARAYTNQLGVTTTSLVKGQQTGSRTRMLNAGAQWLVSTTYYDTEYRPVQLIRDLFDLGTITTERVSTKYKYDLAPVVDVEWTEHLNSPTATIASNRVVKTFTYDHADRLLSVKENISVGSVSKEVTTLAQRYNVLGHLQSKWFQSANGQEFRRKTNYTNNIRGWQTDAKTVYKQTTATELPFYTIKLSYVNGSNYTNGNISKMEWGGKDDAAFTAGLSYTYDGINRLKSAVKPAGASYTYNESETGINYFRNGNIQNLVRAGAAVDNLTYTYAGNRLSSISDASGNNTGVKNGSSSFTYDNNGNMLNDGNRGAILTYNMLNLPNTVTIASKIFTYDYDAAGSKHKYAGDTVNVKYAGIFEYDANNVVKRISSSEGQALFRSGAINFNYYVKDHLGNARVVFNEAGAILQKTDYYPFGLEIDRNNPAVSQAARNNTNRYLYNGKELQVGTGYVDYGARMYMPEIGRWMAVDPLSESMNSWSPYNYTFNNPLKFTDKDGTVPDITIQGANNSSVTVKTDLVDLKVNASSLGIDFGGNYSFSGKEVLQAAVDIGGVVDPTPTLDIIGAGLSVESGDYWGAGASILGASVPYVGDLAKTRKISDGIKVIDNAIVAAKTGLKEGDKVASTSRAARREAMRDAGIPTSQQPRSQSRNASGREYSYETPKKGGGKQTKSVQQQTMDRSHPNDNHWEAGAVKKDADGNVRMNNYGRPRLDSDKSKVNY